MLGADAGRLDRVVCSSAGPTTLVVPSRLSDTPYIVPAISIVRFWWVTMMIWDSPREPPEQLQEPVQVDVVQGRLDLVHQIERAGPRLEDREQERQRGQRALTTRQQPDAAGPAPGRRWPPPRSRCPSRSSGSVSTRRPSPPGNISLNSALELPGDVAEGRGRTLGHLAVDLRDRPPAGPGGPPSRPPARAA